MPRYKLTIAYDGTRFHGWQKQELGLAPEGSPQRSEQIERITRSGSPAFEIRGDTVVFRTVQDAVEQAVRHVVRQPVVVLGASRTDAGVHAAGQVAAFTCSGRPEEDVDLGRHPRGTGRDSSGTLPTLTPSSGSGGPEAHPPSSSGGIGWPVQRGTEPLRRAINSRLPEDVAVVDVEIVDDGFDPISDCVSKGYSYTVHISRDRPVWDRAFVHHVWVPLDVEKMQRGAAMFVGRHDFGAFAAAGHGRESTVRTIHECSVAETGLTDQGRDRGGADARSTESPPLDVPGGGAGRTGDPGVQREGVRAGGEKTASLRARLGCADIGARRIRIDVSGDGFLYNMVRIIAGTLVEVGRGKIDPARIPEIIASRDRSEAGPTLPAKGLCLEWIRYRGGG